MICPRSESQSAERLLDSIRELLAAAPQRLVGEDTELAGLCSEGRRLGAEEPGCAPVSTVTYAQILYPLDTCMCMHTTHVYSSVCLPARPCYRACPVTRAGAHVSTMMHIFRVYTKMDSSVGSSLRAGVWRAVMDNLQKQSAWAASFRPDSPGTV